MDELTFPAIRPAPRNGYELASFLGLGEPLPRGLAAAAVGTVACYALKWPGICFKENGLIKQFDISPDEDDEERTQVHFALVPLAFFAVGYLFF
jgi:hypothetical protein